MSQEKENVSSHPCHVEGGLKMPIGLSRSSGWYS